MNPGPSAADSSKKKNSTSAIGEDGWKMDFDEPIFDMNMDSVDFSKIPKYGELYPKTPADGRKPSPVEAKTSDRKA
jgi:hypothetical protein